MHAAVLVLVMGVAAGQVYAQAQPARPPAATPAQTRPPARPPAQPARPPARRPAAAPAPIAKRTEPAMINCPQVLGEGVQTKQTFCDVQIGRDPAAGITIALPPHTGAVTLTFDLHNRHTYSEELVKANRGYRRYTATIGVLTMDNTLLSRAIVHSEFRSATDLVDRISGGTGPGGLKAVAPSGSEPIVITIPAEEDAVSILGEKLMEARLDGVDNFSASGRPIAVISNVMIEYQPGPARRPPARRK
jgi:hypothetical protein